MNIIQIIVLGQKNKAMAEKHADTAKIKVEKMFRNMKLLKISPWGLERDLREKKWKWDPYISINYTGTDYYVIEADLRSRLPK